VDPWLEWCIEKAGVKQGGHAVYAGRPSAASPATGQMKKHLIEQATLVDAALTK
jgi:2-oxoglutarate dehydrogenase E1 component